MTTANLLHTDHVVIARQVHIGAHIRSYAILCKVGIAALSTLSAAAGFFLCGGRDIGFLFSLLSGIFLIACGAAAINQIQEIAFDALMERTKRRPLVTGRIGKREAILFSSLLIAFGLCILLIAGGKMAAFLGTLAILWYNGVYTPLKRVTTIAFLPGGIVGAIPPAIGWVAAGGNLFDGRIFCLSLFLFMWQIPHFWLLLVRYGKQYRGAGFPTLFDLMTNAQIARMTLVWIAGLIAVVAVFPLFGLLTKPVAMFLVALSGFLLLGSGLLMIWGKNIERSSKPVLHATNYYMLIVLIAVSLSVYLK